MEGQQELEALQWVIVEQDSWETTSVKVLTRTMGRGGMKGDKGQRAPPTHLFLLP
jgi:hypothetical protein